MSWPPSSGRPSVAAPSASGRRSSTMPPPGSLLDMLGAAGEVIHQDVFAEVVGIHVEGATFVDGGHLVDEVLEVRIVGQREDVELDAVFGAAAHLAQSLELG